MLAITITIIITTTMTSAQPNISSTPGKSIHISSSHTPFQQQQQITSPGVAESSSSRRSSGTANQSFASPRNNQGKKKPNKNSKRPQLAGVETMAESVRHSRLDKLDCMLSLCEFVWYIETHQFYLPIIFRLQGQELTISGCNAKC